MKNRFPVFDVTPSVHFGGEVRPAKGVTNEEISVRATIIREGHESLFAEVVLIDPHGREVQRNEMREYWPGTDRYEANIRPLDLGLHHFFIHVFDEGRVLNSISEQFPLFVEVERALYGAWYEFFPRSEGAVRKSDGTIVSGTFKTAEQSLARVAQMGFDVLYLPPIHPIGHSFRKGRNNTLTPTANDPGVPWAIGNSDGGHDAINPELGSMNDFKKFVQAANKSGIEIAMDFALQCSPDHPWAKDHRDWFTIRSDGSIAYAENPPKKYQDIFPINFDKDYEGILNESIRILTLWISQGVKIFRVDNPHTKPVQFWQDLIKRISNMHHDVVFLAEAFTRPAIMGALGKAGFQQSYTYFTWRTTKDEIVNYGSEVAHETSAFFRPNFWVNTPDILPFHLQSGDPLVFASRALLASTLAPSWGMYAGFELFEAARLKEGGEEYLDSEKYEIKIRDWKSAGESDKNLMGFVGQLNSIRRSNPALHYLRNLRFHQTDSDQVIAYSKRDGDNLILIIVNLNPNQAQETYIHWDMYHLGISEDNFNAVDLLNNKEFELRPHSHIRIDPGTGKYNVGFILKVEL
jgi:starch synthase (maltosyl-transferring)